MMANFRTYTVVGGMPEVVQRFLLSGLPMPALLSKPIS